MKIAIVGSGISGLGAAHALYRNHSITVFESGNWIGGHTHTVQVDMRGHNFSVDTGFIVFNESHYPLFTQLLAELRVETQLTSMSFSVRHDPSGLEYCSQSLGGFFAQRRNLFRPRFHRMWLDVIRFNREAPALEGVRGDETTVLDYVEGHGYSTEFLEHYLVPLGASLWSCPPGTFRAFPIRFVIDFMRNHHMLQLSGQPAWRVVRGGSRTYVDAITAPFRDRIHLGRGVARIRRPGSCVEVIDSHGNIERFDQIVLACHADQALRLLEEPDPVEREVLEAFPYQPNDAILHTDTSMLPQNRRAWASWNYHIPNSEMGEVQVTYNMSTLQRLAGPDVFNVTLNDPGGISPERVIARSRYEHPIFTRNRSAAQSRHHELLGIRRTYYCGAYWGYGFHEDGLRSGLAVSRALEARRAA